jgi:hypothetical protein
LRLVKRLVVEGRRRPRGLPHPAPAYSVPIVIAHSGRYVHYPTSPDDLRAVLSRLPLGVADGVAKIELLLPDAAEERTSKEIDPFIGRLRDTSVAGVYSGSILGSYFPDTAIVQLFAYVYDRSRPDHRIIDIYLRLRMLTTFVHELAHHQDHTTRGGRRHWRRRDTNDRETYARDLEHSWTQDYVVPYLAETYPSEVAELGRWLEAYGGKSVSLGVLAGDPRYPWLPDGDLAFEGLVERVLKGERAPDTFVEFAADLRLSGHVDEAREILAHVLRDHPGHPRALVVEGTILLHEGHVDEASAIADQLARGIGKETDAWELVRDVAEARADWSGVIAAGKQLRDGREPSPYKDWRNREVMTRAFLELGDLDRVERCLQRLREWDWLTRFRPKELAALECLVLVRRGAYEEALAAATKLVDEGAAYPVVLAVRFEAAHRLGRPDRADALTPAARDRLRWQGYAAWLDRLDAL